MKVIASLGWRAVGNNFFLKFLAIKPVQRRGTEHNFGRAQHGEPKGWEFKLQGTLRRIGTEGAKSSECQRPITKLPGIVFNENFRVLGGRYEFPWSCSCYAHVGVEVVLDFFKMENPSYVHDLESYINLLKCPQRVQVQKDGPDFLSKAREWLLGTQNFNPLPWRNAASNMVNLVQSQRT
ncbi:Galactolipase DONGLE, chloroplastic [Vitis vinifera]|uniref:Galactolipase DONGLE, chloroplastic n=1 Tax=Vitis vinifera TaxID=29760 RepID=A0A438FTC8_VITVI|nr:Galactolipase DONGLE, chloroplastic [Vitis vinifera]